MDGLSSHLFHGGMVLAVELDHLNSIASLVWIVDRETIC
jgi:hypothetical protein